MACASIEDQRKPGLFLKQALTERADMVTWVESCAQARKAMRESSYDVIVLDPGLPDGDCLDLLREWRGEALTNRYIRCMDASTRQRR
jgi:two-component system copper resistance phosphate regulon response regulator CusR/two-component system response regulator QseB